MNSGEGLVIMRILICEKNKKCTDLIIKEIKNCECHHKIEFETYDNIFSAHIEISHTSYDLAFIGEQVDGYNGLVLCQYLKQVQPECEMIVLSSHYDCLKDVFDLKARQLIIYGKEEMICKEFNKFLGEYEYQQYKVIFHSENGDLYLKPSEILYIHTYKELTEVMTTKGMLKGQFDDLIRIKEKLEDYMFFQVHCYYFANVDHVLLVRKGKIGMDNGDMIPSAVLNHQITRQIYQICMRGF